MASDPTLMAVMILALAGIAIGAWAFARRAPANRSALHAHVGLFLGWGTGVAGSVFFFYVLVGLMGGWHYRSAKSELR